VRVVIDVIQQCNLRCTYCHPGEVWQPRHLDVDAIAGVFAAVERHGVLEVVVSGGEPTLHPQFASVLDATALLERTAAVLVTNATRVDDALAERIARANLARVCVSLDSVDPAIHATARGDNHERVLAGLRRIRAAGARVTVISVVHQGNFRHIGELSDWLLSEGLADQHHLCAPSYSGEAREHYPGLALRWDDFFAVQASVDARHTALADRGLFVTFNSFWPATGERSSVVDAGRSLTLQQISEQVKGTLLHVRPDGQVRVTATSWGRETVGNAAVGNVTSGDPYDLVKVADGWYRDGSLGQLPRRVEARHKFQLGACDVRATDRLIDDNHTQPVELIRLIKLRSMADLSVLSNPFTGRELATVGSALRGDAPERFRAALHPSGVGMIYDRLRSHVTLLTPDEWETFTRQPPGALEPVV
jgi:MoaA/NifB/PqqE/SkfB family radical SAM enzyme